MKKKTKAATRTSPKRAVKAGASRSAKRAKASPTAKLKLSYTHRKEHVRSIEDAKKPDTRARRIAKAVAELKG